MSSSSTNVTLGTIGSNAGIPNLNVATIPENIRNGDSKAKAAYSEGLAFEDMLVNELSQQLATTMYGGSGSDDSDSSTDGSSDSTDGSSSSSMLGGASAYASMIPQALTSSIMDGGGLGMAASFAQELDPSLLSQASGTTSSTAADAGTGNTSTTSSSPDDQASGTAAGSARQVSI